MIQFLRKYIIWIVLLIALSVSQIKKLLKKLDGISIDIGPSETTKKTDLLVLTCYIIAALCIILIAYDLLQTTQDFKASQNKVLEPVTKNQSKIFTESCNKEEYERITRETTLREIKKLKQTTKFKDMLAKKGEKEEEWVWQTKERTKNIQNNFYKENTNLNCGEEDDDHLSQITLSN